jgi:hypothetical protein
MNSMYFAQNIIDPLAELCDPRAPEEQKIAYAKAFPPPGCLQKQFSVVDCRSIHFTTFRRRKEP